MKDRADPTMAVTNSKRIYYDVGLSPEDDEKMKDMARRIGEDLNNLPEWRQRMMESRKNTEHGAGIVLQFLFFFSVVFPCTYGHLEK